jgi:antitoxin component of MazEF toxin-antitoxin module
MTQEATITKKVILTGDSFAIIIPREVASILEVIPGDVVEAKIRKLKRE